MDPTLLHLCALEFLGTLVLILMGDGVCAACNLNKSKAQGAGWVVIAFGWGLAVMSGVFVAHESGAHLNPAVTIGLATSGGFQAFLANAGVQASTAVAVCGYIVAQMVGGFCGAVLVWLVYRDHFNCTENKEAVLGTYCTMPAIDHKAANFFTELVATFILVLMIIGTGHYGSDVANVGAVSAWPITAVIVSLGMSLGGPTGYAMNPARDLSPRIAHALLPMKYKRDSGWSYSWVPVFGPIAGAICAVGVGRLFGLC